MNRCPNIAAAANRFLQGPRISPRVARRSAITRRVDRGGPRLRHPGIEGLDSTATETIASMVSMANSGGRRYDYVVGPAKWLSRTISAAGDSVRRGARGSRSHRAVRGRRSRPFARASATGGLVSRGRSSRVSLHIYVAGGGLEAERAGAAGGRLPRCRDDGRGEDDLIQPAISAAPIGIGLRLAELARLRPAIAGVPTNTVGDRQEANIYYSSAVVEFTGRAGVLDLVRQFNLTVEQRLAISDHMPVWAEFGCAERTPISSPAAQTPFRARTAMSPRTRSQRIAQTRPTAGAAR